MTTTTAVRGDARLADGARLHLPARRRSWPLIGGGMTAALLGAVVAASAALSADRREPVLALSRPVAAGHALTAGDVRAVRVGADPSVQVIPASDKASVIGRVATTALPAGTLLHPAHVGSSPDLDPGQVSVGVALEPGRFPPRLGPGDRVLALESATAGDANPAGELATGVVTSVEPLQSGSGMVIGLKVSREAATPLAGAATARRLSLALLPPS